MELIGKNRFAMEGNVHKVQYPCIIAVVTKKTIDMIFKFKKQNPQLLEQLSEYTKDIVGLLMDVYKKLPCGFPEYIYQEALKKTFNRNGVPHTKEYIHHPLFYGEVMESYIRMDFVVERNRGNNIRAQPETIRFSMFFL